MRSSERTCEHKSQAVGILEAEADDHQVEITVGNLQQSAGRVGFALDLMLLLQRPDDALGGPVAVVDQQNAAAPPELIDPDSRGRGNAHLLLGRGAHQHLVGEHFQPRDVLHPRDQRDVVDRLGEEIVGAGFQPLHPVGGLVERGDHDHRNMLGARLGLQPPADLETVHAGHHHVEQDHVGPLPRADMQRLGPLRAVRTSKYSAVSRASRSFTLASTSSTTRTRAVMAAYRASPMNCLTVSRNIVTEIGLEI